MQEVTDNLKLQRHGRPAITGEGVRRKMGDQRLQQDLRITVDNGNGCLGLVVSGDLIIPPQIRCLASPVPRERDTGFQYSHCLGNLFSINMNVATSNTNVLRIAKRRYRTLIFTCLDIRKPILRFDNSHSFHGHSLGLEKASNLSLHRWSLAIHR